MRSVIKSAKSVDEAVELGLKELGLTKSQVEIEILEQAKKGLFGLLGSKEAIVKVSEKIDVKEDILRDVFGSSMLKKEDTLKEEVSESRKKPEVETVSFKEEILVEETFDEKKELIEESVEVVETDFEKEGLSQEEVEKKLVENLQDLLEKMHIVAKVESKFTDNSLYLNLKDISEEDTGIVIGRKGETLDSLQYILSLIANRYSQDFHRVTLDVANYRARRRDAIENNARKVAFKVLKSKRSIALEPMNAYERRIVHYALQNYKEIETVSQGNFPNRKVVVKYKG
ncbi:RNA-binding cell elongation regulator Jag/EloR [Peptoniphilaceae bacterium SGI.131]